MKRALLVGINYIGTPNALNGCINDIDNVAAYLQRERGYAANSMIIMSDTTPRKPTRANILTGFRELLQGVRAGDELWFHFSGHGSLQRDTNGDEESGSDSCICPLDFDRAGMITDDVVRSALVGLVPEGVRLYAVLDMCHSGTGCDLRYKYDDSSYLIETGPLPSKYEPDAWALRQTSYEHKRYAKTAGSVYCISGCQDSQTSADAFFAGKAAGALTHCLLESLKSNSATTYKWKHLLKDVCCRERIGRFTQRTSITSGTSLNLDELVFFVPPPPQPQPQPQPQPMQSPPLPPLPPLPPWVQAYLQYLQRRRWPVPAWLRTQISQLQARRNIGNGNPIGSNPRMRMPFMR